ncbi:hypothetical protein [Stappia sp. ES.058]|uniref:hypothetical protein n=1 Tax=Stappia sp. ES.058 TaxID=1881061 RepID=UPI00087DE102|nr:hypothetical protein [Stappia sp. ES.058]SDT96711.1 hypothetical protein SAMN05428979_0785 [Stappia sp. ES.058]
MTDHVLLTEAGAGRCKRPLWGDTPVPLSEKFVCGAPVRSAGESWCKDCRARLFDTVQKRRAGRRADDDTKPRPARVPRFQAIHSSIWSAG